MSTEIERKFLVKKELWNSKNKTGLVYRQGYLLRSRNNTIRIRLVDNKKGYITIKGRSSGASRLEYEYKIPQKDAQELLVAFCEAIVSKKRYKVKIKGKVWEVDEFMGDNEGLIIAEIELKHEAEKFEVPAWAGKDVTGDKRYYNSELSVNPYKSWSNE